MLSHGHTFSLLQANAPLHNLCRRMDATDMKFPGLRIPKLSHPSRYTPAHHMRFWVMHKHSPSCFKLAANLMCQQPLEMGTYKAQPHTPKGPFRRTRGSQGDFWKFAKLSLLVENVAPLQCFSLENSSNKIKQYDAVPVHKRELYWSFWVTLNSHVCRTHATGLTSSLKRLQVYSFSISHKKWLHHYLVNSEILVRWSPIFNSSVYGKG